MGFEFRKITNLKIKSFNLKSSTLNAIDLDGKLYVFGRDILYRSLIGNINLIVNDIHMYEFIFDGPVKSVVQLGTNIIINTSDEKSYGFADDLMSVLSNKTFGDNFTQGQEISEGIKFTQLELLRDLLCGLTATNELYCRGSLPMGLRYETNYSSDDIGKFRKISNLPRNTKKVIFGYKAICFLLDTNAITCAGEEPSNGIEPKPRDREGRLIYNGGNNELIFQAPNIIAPIM